MELKTLVRGLQHLGIPTKNLPESEQFYEQLGFTVIYRGRHGPYLEPVSFLEKGGLVLEVYETADAAGRDGAIAHLALDTADIEDAWNEAKRLGLSFVSPKIEFLPFWESGVRYFIVEGPNKEKIEFNQRL